MGVTSDKSLIIPLNSEGQERSWLSPAKKPTRADAQAMMPGGQTRRVHREPCLASDWPTKGLAASQNRGALSSQAHCLAQLFEVLALEFFALHKCADVSRRK